MDTNNQNLIYTNGNSDKAQTYLDIQAEVGISKHFGGFRATDILHNRCSLSRSSDVLEVGCGTGAGSIYIANKYGCKVDAVDISEKMLFWARKRADQEEVKNQIHFQKADILKLPFENDRFDVVLVESVLAFVDDKTSAIEELIRVTKPGGYLGLNEYSWISEPLSEVLSKSVFLGMATITKSAWEDIWEKTQLVDRTIEHFLVEPRQEFKDRIKWVGGWIAIFQVWSRVIKLLLRYPGARDAIKQQIDIPTDISQAMGYSLLTGRKPEKM